LKRKEGQQNKNETGATRRKKGKMETQPPTGDKKEKKGFKREKKEGVTTNLKG